MIKFTNLIVDNVDDILNDDDIALGKKITILVLFLYNYYVLLNTNNIFICVYVEIAKTLNMLHMDGNDGEEANGRLDYEFMKFVSLIDFKV